MPTQELTTFNFTADDISQDIRVVQIDGAPWFVTTDVCMALGIKSSAAMATQKLSADQKGRHPIATPGGTQNLSVISESGLYKLVLRADGAHAIPFQDWVMREVLPTIRKTGAYVVAPQVESSAVNAVAAFASIMERLGGIEAVVSELKAIAAQIKSGVFRDAPSV